MALTRINNNSLSAVTAAGIPVKAGSVVQTDTLVNCDTNKSISNTNEGYTGYSISLSNDLQSTSSKIIIQTGTYVGYGNNVSHGFTWSSSSSSLVAVDLPANAHTHYTNQIVYNSSNGPRDGMYASFQAVITPTTVTPQTYYLWLTVTTNNQTQYLNLAANGRNTPQLGATDYWSGSPPTVITITEIAG